MRHWLVQYLLGTLGDLSEYSVGSNVKSAGVL